MRTSFNNRPAVAASPDVVNKSGAELMLELIDEHGLTISIPSKPEATDDELRAFVGLLTDEQIATALEGLLAQMSSPDAPAAS